MGCGLVLAGPAAAQTPTAPAEEAPGAEQIGEATPETNVVPLPGAPTSFADLAEQLVDAVVNVSTSQDVGASERLEMPDLPEGSPFREFFEEFFNNQRPGLNRPRRVNSLGSGFVIDESGIIVTNSHVIADADEIIVNFNDGTELPAELVGIDEKTDMAVLRVEPATPLKAVHFGDSDTLRVGDWVVAIGNPFGLGGTVTAGIVSAQKRDIQAGPYDSFIQTDAAINRGNSGGPLFNMKGEVVGINTAIISPSGGSIGIGFAVPSNLASSVINQLVEFGETRRGWLGVRIQTVTPEIAESLGMDRARGALIAGVTEGGPAEEAGMQTGDVVLSFDGRDVSEMRQLPRIVADTAIGETVDVVVLRDGEEQVLSVVVGRLEEATEARVPSESEPEAEEPAAVDQGITSLGLRLGELTPERRSEFGIDDGLEGVVVLEVVEGGPAEDKGIETGFVISEVSQERVRTPQQFEDAVARLREMGRKSALLLTAAPGGDLQFIVVPLPE
ncbi:HtrA protease/chaperone protein [Lutibaculum baratangense AMV1]|uniref:Probable periplasmic serine endoprotease DegP-like n=1 Tax=Lutibaculum baratangense AMV1 TaxID=631454 RepID=V4R5R5_9HYPH|nr:HtrA protease/chaperone protein [Lutibaculum baratangense AMV1]